MVLMVSEEDFVIASLLTYRHGLLPSYVSMLLHAFFFVVLHRP